MKSSLQKKEQKVIIQVQPELLSGESVKSVQEYVNQAFNLAVPTTHLVTPPPSSIVRSPNFRPGNVHDNERNLINIYKPEHKKPDSNIHDGSKNILKVTKERVGEIPNINQLSQRETKPEVLLDGNRIEIDSLSQLRSPKKSNKQHKETNEKSLQQYIGKDDISTDEEFAFDEPNLPLEHINKDVQMQQDNSPALHMGLHGNQLKRAPSHQKKLQNSKISSENEVRQKELNDEPAHLEKFSSNDHPRKQNNSQLETPNKNKEIGKLAILCQDNNDQESIKCIEQQSKEIANQHENLTKTYKSEHFGDQLEQLRKELLTQLPGIPEFLQYPGKF
jgi:hypothetical protein